jgi:hypothetical protein
VEYSSRRELATLFWGTWAIFALILAVGLWFLQEYARWGLLLLIARGLVQTGAAYVAAPSSVKAQFGGSFAFYAFLLAATAYYLTRPHVACAFGGPQNAPDPDAGKFAWPD